MHDLRRRDTATRVLRLAAVAAVILVVLTACSSSKSNGKSKTTTTSTTRVAAVTKVSDQPRTSGYIGARKDVTNLTCVQDGKQWKVGGTVTNPTNATADYRIFTSFLDQSNVTRGLLQTDVKGLAAQKSQAWSGVLDLDATGLHCGLRVERTGVNGAPPPTEAPTTTAKP